MNVRRILLALMGAFVILSLGAGLWQLADSRSKVLAVEWIQTANRLTDAAQEASARLAMERGITAAILSSPADATAGMQAEMRRVRALADLAHGELTTHVEALAARDADHPLLRGIEELRDGRIHMERYRELVDAQLRGERNELDTRQWLLLMTRSIERLQSLAVVSLLPLRDNIYSYASLPIVKDLLFTLGEYLGRERAALGVAIARGAPLSAAELSTLAEYRSVALHARARVEVIVAALPRSAGLDRAREVFAADLGGRYESLRESIYAASAAQAPYPVDAEAWYRDATRGIDSVLGLSAVVSAMFESNVGRLRDHALSTLWLLASIFIALVVLCIIAARVLQDRVLDPLQALERAATRISDGELAPAPLPAANDELGRLGRAFEHMRHTLVADIARREADAGELRKLYALIEHSAIAMVVADADGFIQYTNSHFATVTGYHADEAIGRKAGFWRARTASGEQYRDMWATVLVGQVWQGEVTNQHKNGELYLASMTLSPVRDDGGLTTHLIAVIHDITERRRMEERLDFVSSHDELTCLPNRALLAQRYALACVEAHGDGSFIALVSVGICGFKRINDSMGRDVGDSVLQVIAQRLVRSAREHDIISRHGGTEFVLMLTRLETIAELRDRLEQIVEAANVPIIVEGARLYPAVRAGSSAMPFDGDALETLLRKTTIALHHAEREGLNFCLYREQLGRDAQERLFLENALRLSLELDGLELHYQAKVDVSSGRMIGVEALARWRHPETNEYISPQRFIPIAEESGLIQHLGGWALREACRQNKAWHEAGLRPMVVAVNLSPLQLFQPKLAELVADVLEESGLAPAWLELELTESTVMQDPDHARRVMTELKVLGVALSIDDFGTGYSSLAYLSEFPVDRLKIDKRFVRDVPADPSAAAISTSIITLAHKMGLKVIAEGVETVEQLAFLAAHDCDEIQGYLYSRPLGPDDFAALLASERPLVLPWCAAPEQRFGTR